MKTDCPVENSLPLPHIVLSQFSPLLMITLPVIIHTGIIGDAIRLIACSKLVPEEQDIVVAPKRSPNFDRANAKISQSDLSAIGVAAQLSVEGDETVALTTGGSLLQNSKARKDVLSRGPGSLFTAQGPQLKHSLPRDTAQALTCVAKNIGFGLMLLGEGPGDIYAQRVGSLVGGLLQPPMINAVSSIQRNGDHIVVERTLKDEAEVVELPPPAVLCVTSDISTPHIPSMKTTLGAGGRPVTPWQASDIGWAPASPLVELVSLTVPPQTERKHTILENDPAEVITELTEHLKKALN